MPQRSPLEKDTLAPWPVPEFLLKQVFYNRTGLGLLSNILVQGCSQEVWRRDSRRAWKRAESWAVKGGTETKALCCTKLTDSSEPVRKEFRLGRQQLFQDFEKGQEILLFPDSPAPLDSPCPCPHCPVQNAGWGRAQWEEEEHSSQSCSRGWEPSRAVSEHWCCWRGWCQPLTHRRSSLPHTPGPPSAKAPALRRELDCGEEHAALSKPITADTGRAGSCPPGSSPTLLMCAASHAL